MIQNKKRIISLILMLTLLVSALVVGAVTASAAEESATISFGSTEQRTSYSTSQQVWSNGGITLTNDKGSSTSNVGNYSNPARFYAKSSITITAPGNIKKIVITGGGESKYISPIETSLSNSGYTVTGNSPNFTVEFDTPVESVTFTASAQIRFASLSVTYEVPEQGCEHNYGEATVTTPATCTTAGEKSSTCSLCGDIKTEPVSATGHSYGEFETTKEASCTKNGTKTRICATCGAEDKQTIPSTGHTQGEEVKTVDATCINAGYTVYSCSTCKENYKVEGEAALGHSGHAVCTRCCEVNAAWTLVTDASSLEIGDQIIIVASGYNYALSTTQNGNNRAQASVTKNGNTVTFGVDVQIITLEAGLVENTFALNVGNGYLYAASSGSNHLKTQTTLNNNGSWAIEISDTGVATIKAQGTNTRNWLRYNSTNNPPIFSCYGSGQADVSIYKAPTNSGKQHSDSCGHVAELNGEVYTSIKDAIDNAESGTITLIDDVTYEGTLAITNENIVIDLNGNNLVADGIVTFGYGVQIIDSGATKGLIDVDREKLVFAPLVDEETGEETSATSTEIVPVWNGEGYVIADVTDRYVQPEVEGKADNSFIIDFKPKFDGVAHSYVKGGETATGLTFEVRITGGDFDKTYTVEDSLIAEAYNGKSVRLNLINAQEGVTYTVQLIIKSECGLNYVGELGQYTYPVPADAE